VRHPAAKINKPSMCRLDIELRMKKNARRTTASKAKKRELRYDESMKKTAGRSQSSTDLQSKRFVEEFRKAAKRLTDRATASPSAALELLVKEGIYTKAGRLTKNYR
jgi:hypothetical protein